MRKINYIVVHCSATREGCTLTSEALEAEHRRRGFRTTGYHYYIRRDGTVLGTRSLELPGAHCRGHNKYSIGICSYITIITSKCNKWYCCGIKKNEYICGMIFF